MKFDLEILGKSDMRLVGGWASVEIIDLEKDYVPVNELAKSMVLYMKNKGGQIFYEHKNKSVGKVIYWDIRKHPETEKMGIYIIGCIDKGYEFDNIVWNKIKEGELKGFSISGFAKSEDQIIKSNDGKEERVRVLKNIEMMEISLVNKPANQYALIDEYNMFAKGIKTNDLPDLIKDLIVELNDKVDTDTLQRIISIIASYNKNNLNFEAQNNENGVVQVIKNREEIEKLRESLKDLLEGSKILNDYEDDEEKCKIVRDMGRLFQILITEIVFNKKYNNNNNSQVLKSIKDVDEIKRILENISSAYKGVVEDIDKLIKELINEVDNISVNVDNKDRVDNIGENNNVCKDEGCINTESEGYVNPTYGKKRKNKVSIVKHYIKIGELMSKVEKMVKL